MIQSVKIADSSVSLSSANIFWANNSIEFVAGIASFTKLERINRSDSCSVFTLFSEISEKKSKLLRENLAKKTMSRTLSELYFLCWIYFKLFYLLFILKWTWKNNSEKKNGRFCEINEEDFDSEKGVALAFDNETAQHVIVKALYPRKPVELEYARREARTLAQLG